VQCHILRTFEEKRNLYEKQRILFFSLSINIVEKETKKEKRHKELFEYRKTATEAFGEKMDALIEKFR
jgi:RNA-splicing ligase RtcB